MCEGSGSACVCVGGGSACVRQWVCMCLWGGICMCDGSESACVCGGASACVRAVDLHVCVGGHLHV